VEQGRKSNLEIYFFPDRAMSWCTAIHAEVRALLAAGAAARGTTLYTTTFPCFQCAEKITQVGIKDIWFTEPYPDTLAAKRLEIGRIEFRQFEGVRSSVFERFFSSVNRRTNP
jgi:deoxycytidylate deaminase